MLRAYRSKNPGRPLAKMLVFEVCWAFCWLIFTAVYRLRIRGRDGHAARVPARGPLLVVANHQSHLDPPALGMVFRSRHLWFVARESLFRVPLLGPLIDALNAIPISRGRSDAAGVRAALGTLEAGRALLVFPEGTRSIDGELDEFKRGVWLLVSRSACDVLPMAIAGSREAWPRGQRLPSLLGSRIAIRVGEPIRGAELIALGPDAGLARLKREVEELLMAARVDRAG